MNRIKIGFFIDAYRPGAGTENQLRGLLCALDRNRVEATLTTLRDPVSPTDRNELPWPVDSLNVRSLGAPDAWLQFVRLVVRLRRKRLDVAMIYFVDANLFVVPACRLAGVGAIVVNRRDAGYWYTASLLRRLRLVNRMADRCVVNSHAVKRIVANREGFDTDQIDVVPNALWDQGGSMTQLTREALGLGPAGPVVGIIANLRRVKRVDRFIEVAAGVSRRVPDARFAVLGHGELEGELRALTRQLGVEEKVTFMGRVGDVRPYLRHFDVGVLTSESEGLSNALIEYAAAGVPAVAFRVGGNEEVIVDGRTGFLVEDGASHDMVAKVVQILEATQLRVRLGGHARRLAGERFSPEGALAAYMALFRRLSALP